jgi:hypothetical protein
MRGQGKGTGRRQALTARIQRVVRAIREDDDDLVEAIADLSRRRRLFAPLALLVGAVAMLFDGLKVLLANWRLTLVMVAPALWIWLAMYDLKAHVLHGKSFNVLRGPILVPLGIVIVAITIACFFLNAVFAYAIAGPRPPKVRPAFAAARGHLPPIVVSGVIVGAALAFAATVTPRWEKHWFTLSLGAVVGVMMVCYVAVPSRLIGMKATYSRRDQLTATALGTALSATVCTPPYVLGRIGLLMLGSPVLLIPGIFVLAFAATLQAGATGAVRAIKLSASLTAGHEPGRPGAGGPEPAVGGATTIGARPDAGPTRGPRAPSP